MARAGMVLLILCIPILWPAPTVHATESIAAGFVPSALWLSQSTPTAGSAVRVSTVIYNSSHTALDGSVTFTVDTTTIGSAPFSLGAGESVITSVTWTTTEGTHTLKATITGVIDQKTKAAATIDQTVTTPISVTVLPELPKTPAREAIETAQSAVASSTPIVASIISKTTETAETIRRAGESYFADLAGEQSVIASSPPPKGSVLGTSTEMTRAISSASDNEVGSRLGKVVLPLFRYPALFYPVFLFLILFAFWLLAKNLRNPKRR